MDPFYEAGQIRIFNGDCQEVMAAMDADSVTAVVCDPPYGLGFMGKAWDHGVPSKAVWVDALRVTKPGGILLAFGGTRTYHRLACAIEDAGWDIRDCLSWIYGSGFPKSLDISKALDKAAGAEREKVQQANSPAYQRGIGNTRPWMDDPNHKMDGPIPVTDAAREWEGYASALKPAWEPIIMAMKPLDGTFAANAIVHGVAGINVDGCRIGTESIRINTWDDGAKPWGGGAGKAYTGRESVGRWPANLVLDEEAAAMLDEQSGNLTSGKAPTTGFVRNSDKHRNSYGSFEGHRVEPTALIGDSGGASRFFYTAKASKAERSGGLDTTGVVLYAPPQWVNEVLEAQLPEDMARSLRKGIEGSTIEKSAESAWSMCWCGSARTDPCHPAIRSIIEMKRSSTIDWKTSSASMRPHTNGCIAAAFSSAAFGGSLAGCVESESPWGRKTGICPKKDGHATDDVGLATSVELWLTNKPEEGGGHKRMGGNTHPT